MCEQVSRLVPFKTIVAQAESLLELIGTLYTQRMMSRRTMKIVAVLLAAIAALTCLLGYDAIYDRNVRDEPTPQSIFL